MHCFRARLSLQCAITELVVAISQSKHREPHFQVFYFGGHHAQFGRSVMPMLRVVDSSREWHQIRNEISRWVGRLRGVASCWLSWLDRKASSKLEPCA